MSDFIVQACIGQGLADTNFEMNCPDCLIMVDCLAGSADLIYSYGGIVQETWKKGSLIQ
jgi:hypothetical protein